MPHTSRQQLLRAIKGGSKLFGSEFKNRPFYAISKIPYYVLMTLVTAKILHIYDVPTLEELELTKKTVNQRINQLEGLLLKLDHRDN